MQRRRFSADTLRFPETKSSTGTVHEIFIAAPTKLMTIIQILYIQTTIHRDRLQARLVCANTDGLSTFGIPERLLLLYHRNGSGPCGTSSRLTVSCDTSSAVGSGSLGQRVR